MKNTETVNGTRLISDMFDQMMFPGVIAGVSEHLVRTSQSQENEQDLTAKEVPSFERYFDLSGKQGKKIDLNGLSTKMLRECYQATGDLTSLQFSLKWTNWGTTVNGRFLTASITPYRRTGKGCILLDILEPEVESKYFLSEEQMKKIVFQSKSSDTETDIDEIHKSLITEGGVEALDTAGGNYNGVCIPVLTPGRAEKRQNGRRFKDNEEAAFTLTAQDIHGVALQADKSVTIPVIWYEKYKCYIAIRKLTPKECFRLQGWTDDYFDKAQFVNSDSQLYKQAGDGVTVNVVEDIAKRLE